MGLIAPELAKQNSMAEKLKAENQMEWYGRGMLARHRPKNVKMELIYD
ncbi:MAG: TnpV protein [Clostridiales bacterium]|nr:TnpV protein [Clostridiales bacterium]